MIEFILSRFPCIKKCRDSVPFCNLSKTHLGSLLALLEDDFEVDLLSLESTLSLLLQSHTTADLHEQIADLFHDADVNRSEDLWNAARTELYAFAHFQSLHLLCSLGWPSGYGSKCPFDFRLRMSGAVVPCDVKSASGSAFQLVSNALEGVVRSWSLSHGLDDVNVSLRYQGTLTQPIVGSLLIQKMKAFATSLDHYEQIPSGALTVDFGGVKVDVNLAPAPANRSSGGIQGADALASSLVPSFLGHVLKKSKAAAAHGRKPFALVYVHLPGSGIADIKTRMTFEQSLGAVAADRDRLTGAAEALWLGAVLLDFRSGRPTTTTCCLRQDAAWPGALTPQRFAEESDGALVVM